MAKLRMLSLAIGLAANGVAKLGGIQDLGTARCDLLVPQSFHGLDGVR